MKIAYFTDTFLPQVNGVTNTLGQLDRYLEHQGAERLFFAPAYGGEADEDRVIRFRGIRPVIYPDCSLAFPRRAEVREELERFGPDLVHVVTEAGVGWAGLRCARELEIPVVMSYHTNFDQYMTNYHLTPFRRPLDRYMRWFHGFALSTLCPSRDTADDLRAKGIKRVKIWSRGVDTELFHPGKRSPEIHKALADGREYVALYVGRIAAEKGLDVYLRAMELLPPDLRGRTSFVFTGDGPYLEVLRQSGAENLLFTGVKTGEELAEIYASCDVVVFPSGTETFGNVGLEAMASGAPLICADTGGVTEYTTHGRNAWVFPAGDSAGLARGLEALLETPPLRWTLSRGGLETAAGRSWERIFDRLMADYERAIRTGDKFLRLQAAR